MNISSSDKLVVVKAFAPSNPLPLDAREIYNSLEEAKNYAATSAIAYAGQTIKVVTDTGVTSYNLVPSDADGVNFDLQFVGGGGSGILDIVPANVNTESYPYGVLHVTKVDGDSTKVEDITVTGTIDSIGTETYWCEGRIPVYGVSAYINGDMKLWDGERYAHPVLYDTGVVAIEPVYSTNLEGENLYKSNNRLRVIRVDDKLNPTNIYNEFSVGIGSVQNPSYDPDTRKITLPVLQEDGATTKDLVINLGKDMVVTSGRYNGETKDIELTLTDGSVIKIPAAELVDIYTGAATETVTVDIDSNKKVTASLKISSAAGNLVKTDANGVYISEADFTATKKLITDAEANAKKYTDAELAKEVTARDEAVNTAKTEAVNTAKGYTDGEIAKEVTARNNAITTAKTEAVNTAKKYTDDELAKEVTARDDAIAEVKAELEKTISDNDVTVLDTAKKYTDDKIAAEVTARNNAVAAAKTEAVNTAKSYTDGEVAKEATARDTAIATAKSESKTYTDTEVSKALAEAKEYTDQAAADVAISWIDFGA